MISKRRSKKKEVQELDQRLKKVLTLDYLHSDHQNIYMFKLLMTNWKNNFINFIT